MNNFNNIKSLCLYHYQACPYCERTRQAIDSLNLADEINPKDILLNATHRKELMQGGGKKQVPCLLVVASNGKKEWLYESNDIISYLRYYAKQLQS